MKIGIIAELLKLPLKDSIAHAAQLGAQGVQLHALHEDHDLTSFSAQQQGDLRKFCEDLGLEISAICGDLPGHGFRLAHENPAKIAREKQVIDLLPVLGCHVVTTHIGVIPADTACADYVAMLSAMRELGQYAHKHGGCIAIETGPEHAATLKTFIDACETPGVAVNLDPANLVMVLNEDPVEAVRTLGAHIAHTHVKDGIHLKACDPEKVYAAFAEGGFEQLVAETGELFREVPPGQGQVTWPAYLRALKASGFDGFLTVEREVGEQPSKDIAAAIGFIREQLYLLGN